MLSRTAVIPECEPNGLLSRCYRIMCAHLSANVRPRRRPLSANVRPRHALLSHPRTDVIASLHLRASSAIGGRIVLKCYVRQCHLAGGVDAASRTRLIVRDGAVLHEQHSRTVDSSAECIRSASETRHHATACNSISQAGRRDGAASPRRAAS